MDEVIDDIISLQSSYDDIQAYIDPVQMPNTVSIPPPTHTQTHTHTFALQTSLQCNLWFRLSHSVYVGSDLL